MLAALPEPDAMRRRIQQLMELRGLNPVGLSEALARMGVELHFTSLYRYLQGSDLRYSHLVKVHNALLDYQPFTPQTRVDEAMVPWRNTLWLTDQDATVLAAASEAGIDYVPWPARNVLVNVEKALTSEDWQAAQSPLRYVPAYTKMAEAETLLKETSLLVVGSKNHPRGIVVPSHLMGMKRGKGASPTN